MTASHPSTRPYAYLWSRAWLGAEIAGTLRVSGAAGPLPLTELVLHPTTPLPGSIQVSVFDFDADTIHFTSAIDVVLGVEQSRANPAPQAEFSGMPTNGGAPLGVTFSDDSTGNVTAWSWDFGDTGTSTLQNPTHVYASEDTYDVKLTVTGAGGTDAETKVDYITVTP